MKKSTAEKKLNEIQDYELINETLANLNFGFREGFSGRVMQKLENRQIDLFSSFKKVALTSVAAVAILIVSVYFTDGSLNLDALFGLHNYSAEEEFYSLLNI